MDQDDVNGRDSDKNNNADNNTNNNGNKAKTQLNSIYIMKIAKV